MSYSRQQLLTVVELTRKMPSQQKHYKKGPEQNNYFAELQPLQGNILCFFFYKYIELNYIGTINIIKLYTN